MTTRDDILQAVRSWFAAAIPEITLSAANASDPNQIIPADLKGPRPGLPYLTVKVSIADEPDGVDEARFTVDPAAPVPPPGTPALSAWRMRGGRAGVIDIQGFDAQATTTAAGWLECAVTRLTRPDVAAALDAAGLTIVNRGTVLDTSALLDSEIERRHLRTIAVRYGVRDSGPGLPELLTTETSITLERYDDHPDPLDVVITVTP
tara:strand:+ start:5119 stop:5736 length:618 start_codon:yes stop_codon:yes gene_type:complete